MIRTDVALLLVYSFLYAQACHTVPQAWDYMIEGIADSSMTEDGQNIVVGSSLGTNIFNISLFRENYEQTVCAQIS